MSRASNSVAVFHLLLSADESVWRDCLQCCKPSDTVVLMDTAVMGLTGCRGKMVADFPCTVVVSGPDLEARIGHRRGTIDHPDLVADEEIVRLLESHPHCLSWR